MKLHPAARSLAKKLLILLLLTSAAWAHGGRYRGPFTPGIPSVPSGPTTGVPGSGRRTAGVDGHNWETWWAFNKDEFFPTRGVPLGPSSGDQEASYARGARLPTRREVRQHIIPALIAGMTDRDKEIRNSVAIALGRVGREPELRYLKTLLADRDRTVIEGAIVGLGLLECEPAEAQLIAIVKAARRPARQRGLAIMALGLSGGELAREYLSVRLGRPRSERRARAAQLSSLQALAASLLRRSDLVARDPSEVDPATAPILKGISRSIIKERFFLPTAYAALSKTRDSTAQKQVLAGCLHRKAEVRAGAAIALGRVFRSPDHKVIKRIARLLDAESDRFTRRLMLISLGRMGGPEASKLLHQHLKHRDRQHRAFAILALALVGDRAMIPTFRSGLVTSRDHSLKAVNAIALGLLKDHEGAHLIAQELARNKDPNLRALLVQALMLIGDQKYAKDIESVLAATHIPDLQAAAALSLGLLGAESSKDLLMDMLAHARTITVKAAVATGLGRRGDVRLIEPLVAFVGNKKEQDLSRAFGYVALGILGEKSPALSPFSRISIDSQYDIRIPILDELRDLL